MTCLGPLTLSRHCWGKRCAGAAAAGYHADAVVGLEGHLSRRLQRPGCRKAADGSFAKARDDLREFLGVRVSAETLRTGREAHGRRRAGWPPQDTTGTAAFGAAAGAVEFTVAAGKVNTREEGWKDGNIAVVQKRPAGEPVTPEAGDKQRLPEATARRAWGAIAASQRCRKSWPTRLRELGVAQMAQVHVLADGASGIWKSVARGRTGSLQTLDMYHALGQVAKAGQCLYGAGTPEATAFLARGRPQRLAAGWTGLCRLVGAEYAPGDPPERRASLDRRVGDFAKPTQRLAYAERLRSGQAIGSGVVEGQAKTLGLRLKARGARWRTKNVQSMIPLVCVRHSDQWDTSWAQAA